MGYALVIIPSDLLEFERLCNVLRTLLLHLVFVMHAQVTNAQTECVDGQIKNNLEL